MESWLRRRAPGFKDYGASKYAGEEHGAYAGGVLNIVTTPRGIYDEYRGWMAQVIKYLSHSTSFALIGFGFLSFSAMNSSVVLAVISALCFAISAFFYAHAYGVYGNIIIHEDMPIVTIVENLYDKAEKGGKVFEFEQVRP